MSLKILTNPYERKARFIPALLTFSQLIIWLFIWFPELRSMKAVVINLTCGLGLSLAFTIVSRTLGKRVQGKLVVKWGGMPATIILTHGDLTLNDQTKTRYHKYLESFLEITLPTVEEEEMDPLKAKKTFDSCIDYLIQKTRNTNNYPLIFNENISYGQLRNLLGLKPIGLVICVSLIVAQLGMIISNYGIGYNISAVPNLELASIFISICFLSFWTFFVTSKNVYDAGVNYGKALLQVCEDI